MKLSQLAVATATLFAFTNAFPRMTPEMMARALALENDAASGEMDLKLLKERRDQINQMLQKRASTTFDPTAQSVSVEGAHAFKAPDLAGGDQRGPCPGLNALANHNYLPHNGVADIPTIVDAVNKVYSMSLDLGTFLAVYGTVFDGNPLSLDPGYSIGGYTPNVANILDGAGILGTPTGLSGSHNKYESDVSPTRGDLYVQGDSYRLVLSRFKDYFKVLKQGVPANDQFIGLADFHGQRFNESVSTNPYFFYSPFAGVLVSPAGYSFPVRMMANHSDQFPDGTLDYKTFMSFFAIYGDENNIDSFEYREGHEQIPANWYKRPESQAFSIPAFLLDVIDHGLRHPRLLSITANAGKVNSAAVLDLGDLTGGVFNTVDLLNPDYLFCFLLQVTQAAGPDLLGTTFAKNALGKAWQPLADVIQNELFGKTCPNLTHVDWAIFEPYPGYTQTYNGYNGKLTAPGTNTSFLDGIAGALNGTQNRKRQAVPGLPDKDADLLIGTIRKLTGDLDLPNPPNPANGDRK